MINQSANLTIHHCVIPNHAYFFTSSRGGRNDRRGIPSQVTESVGIPQSAAPHFGMTSTSAYSLPSLCKGGCRAERDGRVVTVGTARAEQSLSHFVTAPFAQGSLFIPSSRTRNVVKWRDPLASDWAGDPSLRCFAPLAPAAPPAKRGRGGKSQENKKVGARFI